MTRFTMLAGSVGAVAITAVAGAVTFSNPASMTIPSLGTGTSTGAPSSLYPSPITVAGLSSLIIDVQVTITGLSHQLPDDIDMLLVGPTGVSCRLMSDAGGTNSVTGVDLTFDDEAAGSLPDTALITAGSFRPSNFGAGDMFPAPAPVSGYGSTLSLFDGTPGNGTWNLFVVDDATGGTGSISGGWSLSIVVPTPGAMALLGLGGLISTRRRRA